MTKFLKYLLKTTGSIIITSILSYIIESIFESLQQKVNNTKMKEA